MNTVTERDDNTVPAPDVGDQLSWVEERAAILEFDAGYSRDDADNAAVQLWQALKRGVGGDGEAQ